MKYVALLAATVVLMVLVWWFLGPGSENAERFAPLIVPTNEKDTGGLVRSAHQLWKASPGYYHPLEVVALIRILNDRLDGDSWDAAAAATVFAWEQVRSDPQVPPVLKTFQDRMVERIVARGPVQQLETVVRVANANGFDAAGVNAALEKPFASPLTAYPGSRAAAVVNAVFRQADYRRAKRYLDKLALTEEAPEESRLVLKRLRTISDQCVLAESRKFDLPLILAQWPRVGTDGFGRDVLRPALTRVGVLAVKATLAKPPGQPIPELLDLTHKAEGAGDYWNTVVRWMIPSFTENLYQTLALIENLVTVYADRFKNPAFACAIWTALAEEALRQDGKDALRAVNYFTKALSFGDDDATRIPLVQKIVQGCLKVLEFARAKAILEQISPKMQTDAGRAALEPLFEAIKKQEGDDAVRVAKQEKLIEQDRRRGRLKNLQDRLLEARKLKHPAEEISALERAIQQAAKEVQE